MRTEILHASLFTVGLFSFVSLSLACSGGMPAGAAGADATQLCSSLCARTQACDTTTDAETCTNECINLNAATVPRLRADVVASIESCFGASDCATVLAGDAVSVCVDDAAASIAPDSAAGRFCSDEASAANQCGAELDQAACLDTAKLMSDATLASADACMSRPCGQISDCVTASMGGSIGSGSGSGSGADYGSGSGSSYWGTGSGS